MALPTLFDDKIVARTYDFIRGICFTTFTREHNLKTDDVRHEMRKYLHSTLKAYSAEVSKASIFISILRGIFNYRQDLLLVIKADFETRGHYEAVIKFFELEFKIFTEQWKSN